MIISIRSFLLSACIILLPAISIAQSLSHTSNSGLILGFGAGSSFQVSDINNSSGYGLDLRLGSYLYKKENAFLSVDWKFRFLAGSNTAWNHIENTDNTYSNIKLNHFNYDLELGLTLNRLRERTRIVASAYLGAGLTHGLTYADLEDAGGSAYDYSGIDPAAATSTIVSDLKELSDGDFESKLESKAAILPTAGIFLGYQLSSSFTLGVDYKINFSLAENPGTFAINMDGMPMEGSSIDMNHYLSLGFKWTLRNRTENAKRYRAMTAPPTSRPAPVQPVAVKPPEKEPEVDITIPYREVHTTSNRDVDITARLQRVERAEDISVKYNGKPVDFEFLEAESKVVLPVYMQMDTNRLEINCRNEFGTASDFVTLIYKESTTNTNLRPANTLKVTTPPVGNVNTNINRNAVSNEAVVIEETRTGTNRDRRTTDVQQVTAEHKDAPHIIITNPPAPGTVDKNIFNLRAQTRNVSHWEDVEIMVNGRKHGNFNLTAEGLISINIALKEGINDIEVKARNNAGKSGDRTSLTYQRKVNFPVIDDVNPVVDPVVAVVDPVVTVVDPVVDPVVAVVDPVVDPVVAVVDPVVDPVVAVTDTVVTVVDPVVTVVDPVTVVTPPATPEPEAIRINPGNSDWQFCLVTPSGKYNRSNLEKPGFKYSGPASSLFFKPIGGGGSAVVAGKKYSLRSGQYYLFTGHITVTVSNSNPGSMGHWSVKIISATAPTTGKGNNRPASPCEGSSTEGKKPRKK